ncbi:hypothetical protein [Mesonia aquimarina]|uniref:hypothetical protein n=1 Tax=Mesonia aquimarina TaxID=1504967 RepID=UPI0013CEA601|nr:hypothetical protein [Mesonia aquimarina]
MKRILLLFTIMIFSCQFSVAQDLLQGDPKKGVEENVNRYTEYLKKELVLNTKQENIVESNLTEFYMNIRDLKQANMNKKDFNRRFVVLKENNINRMRNVLTKPQFDKYITILEKEQEKLNKKK